MGNIAFWSNPVLYTLPRERFNVVIVLEDALRADHLSLYGYSEGIHHRLAKNLPRMVLCLNMHFRRQPKRGHHVRHS